MEFGIALPQYGPATPDAIRVTTIQADELGFRDVWVADHVAIPVDSSYPPSFLFDPISTLGFAAAHASRVRLGTSVLVLPYRHPLLVAKQLATLERLTEGRLVVGVGAGWLEGEFRALGVHYSDRFALLEESVAAIRACWGGSPCSFHGRLINFDTVKVTPKPEHEIPIWFGGNTTGAIARAFRLGDGWQGNDLHTAPADLKKLLAQSRFDRDRDFTVSMRLSFHLPDKASDIQRYVESYRSVGVDHVLVDPTQRSLEDWLRWSDRFAQAVEPLVRK